VWFKSLRPRFFGIFYIQSGIQFSVSNGQSGLRILLPVFPIHSDAVGPAGIGFGFVDQLAGHPRPGDIGVFSKGNKFALQESS
jgi:hypothetical protein